MAEYLIQDSTLTNLGDAIREVAQTELQYTPTQMADEIRNSLVLGKSLINYNITFSSSSDATTIVVIYSQWTDNGIEIVAQDISTTATLSILQNSSFTVMGVDGTYAVSDIVHSNTLSSIRSIASGVYYAYCFSCNGDGYLTLTY